MARVKGAMMTRKRRNKTLKLAKGYYGSKSKLFKTAKEAVMKQAVEHTRASVEMEDGSDGKFYKGTLRSGQVLESETSIIILGDVNPGATVVSKGNVVVLGTLKGSIYVGAGGNENTFVAALSMDPMQIRIADYIARNSDSPEKKDKKKILKKKLSS